MPNSGCSKFIVYCFLIIVFNQEICSKVKSRNNKAVTQLNITKMFLNYDRKTFLMSNWFKLDVHGNSLTFVNAQLLHDIPSDKLFVSTQTFVEIRKSYTPFFKSTKILNHCNFLKTRKGDLLLKLIYEQLTTFGNFTTFCPMKKVISV